MNQFENSQAKHFEKIIMTKDQKSSAKSSTSPCADLKVAYHNCFNKWYSEKFVKGQWDKEECVVEWKKYRDCLSEHLDDKHLSRFLEVDGVLDSTKRAGPENPADGSCPNVPH